MQKVKPHKASNTTYRFARGPRKLSARSGASTLRIVDLFAGAGGISEGFRQAGYSVIGGSDADPDAAATYAMNFPDSQTICGDIRVRSVREKIRAITQQADVIVGGPPCQAFSQVRNHS